MPPEEVLNALDTMLIAFRQIGNEHPGEFDDDTALAVWDRLDQLAQAARILAYQHGAILARRLPDELTDPTIGQLHVETERVERWDGDKVLTDLSAEMANTETGEICQAVPTDILRKVIPAAKPGNTSSKWNKTGLSAAGIQPTGYLEVEWGQKILKRGPRYRPRIRSSREPGARESPPAAPSAEPGTP